MLTKRIIPCLDIKNGMVVKGIGFNNLQNAGDPVTLAEKYSQQGADELVFLDIAATEEERKTLLNLVKDVAKNVFIPFTVGGGITSLSDAKKLLRAGADKISINSAAVKNPQLITELANTFGSQCVVVAIDAKKKDRNWEVYINGGKVPTGLSVLDWAKEAVKAGAGEILLTSIDADGRKKGFDIQLTKLISENVSVPVIASGGAGNMEDFFEVFTKGKADAALAASLFHYREISVQEVKKYLKKKKILIRI